MRARYEDRSRPLDPTPSRLTPRCDPHGAFLYHRTRQRLLGAFGDFFESLPPRAKSNIACVKFICALTLKLLSGSDAIRRQAHLGADVAREIYRWLRGFPELLCQWEGQFPDVSAHVLRVLVEVMKRTSPSPVWGSPERPGAVSSRKGQGKAAGGTGAGAGAKGGISPSSTVVAPASTAVPGRGSIGGGAGPCAVESSELSLSIEPGLLEELFSGRAFLSLPMSAQTNAVSLLYHLPSLSVKVMTALAAVCSRPGVIHNDVRSFILEVSFSRVLSCPST